MDRIETLDDARAIIADSEDEKEVGIAVGFVLCSIATSLASIAFDVNLYREGFRQ